MPRYLITPAHAGICYVTQADVLPAQQLWEGVTVLYRGAGEPLSYRGPFELPPAVQKEVHDMFAEEHDTPPAPWVVDTTPAVEADTSVTANPAG